MNCQQNLSIQMVRTVAEIANVSNVNQLEIVTKLYDGCHGHTKPTWMAKQLNSHGGLRYRSQTKVEVDNATSNVSFVEDGYLNEDELVGVSTKGNHHGTR